MIVLANALSPTPGRLPICEMEEIVSFPVFVKEVTASCNIHIKVFRTEPGTQQIF